MINSNIYMHKDEERILKRLKKAMLVDSSELIEYYKNFEEDSLLPDLIGKTVEINSEQFPRIYKIVKKIAEKLEIDIPKIYTFESFYYDVNAEGLDFPWINISSKAIIDLNNKELEFLIARQMCHIKEDHNKYEILCEQQSKLLLMAANLGSQAASVIPMGSIGVGEIADVKSSQFKLIASQWSRISEYSADFCAYLISKDIKSAISAIKKTILNSSILADEMNLKSYLKQGEDITKLDSIISQYSIFDEQIPYGPFRIKELVAFASSLKVKTFLKEKDLNGEIIKYYDNEQVRSKVNYKNGLLCGEVIEYYENGQLRSKKHYEEGKLLGEVIEYYENGQVEVEGYYKDGKYHGEFAEYYENGQVEVEGYYKDGKYHGEFAGYYENGQVEVEGNYKDGKHHGEFVEYYENGQLRLKEYNKDGVLHGEFVGYYENGQIESKENYKDGKRHEEVIDYYENGQVKEKGNYKDGVLYGEGIGYYENGLVQFEANFNYGKLHGEFIEYYESGKIKEKRYYEDGQLL